MFLAGPFIDLTLLTKDRLSFTYAAKGKVTSNEFIQVRFLKLPVSWAALGEEEKQKNWSESSIEADKQTEN